MVDSTVIFFTIWFLFSVITFIIALWLVYKLRRRYGESARKTVYVLMSCWGLLIGAIPGVSVWFDASYGFNERIFLSLFIIGTLGFFSFMVTYLLF